MGAKRAIYLHGPAQAFRCCPALLQAVINIAGQRFRALSCIAQIPMFSAPLGMCLNAHSKRTLGPISETLSRNPDKIN